MSAKCQDREMEQRRSIMKSSKQSSKLINRFTVLFYLIFSNLHMKWNVPFHIICWDVLAFRAYRSILQCKLLGQQGISEMEITLFGLHDLWNGSHVTSKIATMSFALSRQLFLVCICNCITVRHELPVFHFLHRWKI